MNEQMTTKTMIGYENDDCEDISHEVVMDVNYEGVKHEYKMLNVALCIGRHPIPDVTDSVFPQVVEEPLNFYAHGKVVEAWLEKNMAFIKEVHDRKVPNRVCLYVTGLTPCLTAFLGCWGYSWPCELYLMHYNKDTNKYVREFWN